MSALSFMDRINTQPGIKLLGLRWLNLVAETDWCNYDFLKEGLGNGQIYVPIYAIQYKWDNSNGNSIIYKSYQ